MLVSSPREEDLTSEHRVPVSRAASTRSIRPDDPVAILKGSPKALGWEVDETEEQAAWDMLMGDAMSSTVYESADEGEEVRRR